MDDYLADLPGEAADYLQRVHKGAERMGQLVDDLLAFARLGRAPVKRVRIDPTTTVRQVIDELMDDRKDREVEIVLDPLPPCDADAALLKQVYVNLVSNALKFTRDKNDARIEIGAQASGADTPVYFVKDNGAGFDMQYANKLFGVFQRLHRNDEFEGTGVGLAIVQRVITRHGGRIWAESAPQKGARFFFTIGGLG
jgi:light-regulated signal transduction histidine kinase (bacteriophytochrome)